VVQVVATVATAPVGGWGGAALGAAIGSVDDLLFTALELGTGYIIPEQALLQVGQTLLKAGVQVAAQGAFQGYEKQAGGLMAAWGKNFMGEATVNFLQQLTTNTLNGAIDAVELSYDDDGNLEGLGFDMERWGESVYGVRALAGYAGSFARSATQSLLKGTAVGFLGEGANNYNALIKTASALAGEGVGSLIDGEFSINVLNLTDILSPFIEDKELLAKMDMGLFSMNFARDKNGNLRTTSRINSAGANVGGLVGLARSVAGLTEAYDNIRIGLSGADEKTAIALRGISTNGQEASQSLFDQILSGETTLQEAYRVAVGEIAKTTSTADGKEISLNMEDLNGFELGVVLAHEAMRNGRNDGEEGQRLETIDAVLAHSDHAMQVLEKYGLGALGYQMVQEAIDYAKMQNGEISQEDFEAYVDGKNLKAGIAIHDFLRLTRSVPHQVGNQVWESMEYTGEESGWYMNLGIVGKYISNMGPHYTVAKEGVKPYDTEWYTNNGFISPKIFMYSPESLDSQPTIPAHPLLPKHESSYIPELPIISYQETVTSRQSKIKDTPLYFGKYRTIEHSNVNVQVGSGYASAYQAGFEAALKLGAGSIISFNNGTDLIVWEINGIKLTTMWSQNDDFQKGPVFSYQQDFTGRYTSMYEVYNMPEGIEKGWRNFLGGLVGY
jgi:hypothetical protein